MIEDSTPTSDAESPSQLDPRHLPPHWKKLGARSGIEETDPQPAEGPSEGAAGDSAACPPANQNDAAARRLPLTNGRFALVDAEDWERVSARRWQVNKSKNGLTYAQTTWRVGRGRNAPKRAISLHRFIACALPGQTIDHWDGDGLNCTRKNLRYCTQRENCENKIRSTNRLRREGFKGTSFHKPSGRWFAYICAGDRKPNGERKQIHLGCFPTAEEAARAYDRAALKYFGEYAALNFPLEPVAPESAANSTAKESA